MSIKCDSPFYVQLLDCELDEVPGLDSLQDFLRTFTLDQGKKATDEDGDYMGEFKVSPHSSTSLLPLIIFGTL